VIKVATLEVVYEEKVGCPVIGRPIYKDFDSGVDVTKILERIK